MSCDPSTYLSFYLLETFYLPTLLIPASPRFRTAACHSLISFYYVSFCQRGLTRSELKSIAHLYIFFLLTCTSAQLFVYIICLCLSLDLVSIDLLFVPTTLIGLFCCLIFEPYVLCIGQESSSTAISINLDSLEACLVYPVIAFYSVHLYRSSNILCSN